MEHLTLRIENGMIWIEQHLSNPVRQQYFAVSPDQVPLLTERLVLAAKELQSEAARAAATT
ncbi:MAG TPA: hypothetical protein VK638_52325 [Edaphobacter sp.]|nr:hypothetical protein [Edaphobacter sp.]